MSYASLWLRAFVLTTAIELVIAVPILRPCGASAARRACAVVAANLVSHPLLWFVLTPLLPTRMLLVAVGEAWAFSSEVAVYLLALRALNTPRAVAASALANCVSFSIGVSLGRLGMLG